MCWLCQLRTYEANISSASPRDTLQCELPHRPAWHCTPFHDVRLNYCGTSPALKKYHPVGEDTYKKSCSQVAWSALEPFFSRLRWCPGSRMKYTCHTRDPSMFASFSDTLPPLPSCFVLICSCTICELVQAGADSADMLWTSYA